MPTTTPPAGPRGQAGESEPQRLRRHAQRLRRELQDRPYLQPDLREAMTEGADWLESAANSLDADGA
ncbi:hypothetical protein [Fodinicurvata fenggangensis]|uniref:hypothetical protein n=1 Tax=Fodinicurvata fenggangensis TaxID=1121830 RepID=UPI000558230E|nr:hypothetical protein [Fodinicurvata fenggangensis]